MSKVAFIGLGAMGSRMAANLLKAGHELTVWNLEPEAADKLVSLGATKSASPREAASGNEFVVTMLSNDEVSRKVWGCYNRRLGRHEGGIYRDRELNVNSRMGPGTCRRHGQGQGLAP